MRQQLPSPKPTLPPRWDLAMAPSSSLLAHSSRAQSCSATFEPTAIARGTIRQASIRSDIGRELSSAILRHCANTSSASRIPAIPRSTFNLSFSAAMSRSLAPGDKVLRVLDLVRCEDCAVHPPDKPAGRTTGRPAAILPASKRVLRHVQQSRQIRPCEACTRP